MKRFHSVFADVAPIALPAFSGTRVQMMPVVLGDPASIPEHMEQWRDTYARLCAMQPQYDGMIGYLTVDEHVTQGGATHRRGGMHVDAGTISPETLISAHGGGGSTHGGSGGYGHGGGGGYGRHGGGGGYVDPFPTFPTFPPMSPPRPRIRAPKRVPTPDVPRPTVPPIPDPLNRRDRKIDLQPLGTGMLTVSSHVGCQAWSQVFDGWPGEHGDCEHLRAQAGEATILLPERAYWLDTLCVHESIPMAADTPRQFVRLSMPSDAPWYDNSTPNPLGVMPSGPVVEALPYMRELV